MMEQMFHNASYPFYRFGDFFYLNKISEKDWVEYICQRFESTGKHISEELAREICQVTDLITISAPKHLEMSDPILALWLKRRVWKES